MIFPLMFWNNGCCFLGIFFPVFCFQTGVKPLGSAIQNLNQSLKYVNRAPSIWLILNWFQWSHQFICLVCNYSYEQTPSVFVCANLKVIFFYYWVADPAQHSCIMCMLWKIKVSVEQSENCPLLAWFIFSNPNLVIRGVDIRGWWFGGA